MRKLYSLVLMAIALLIGTNAWATSRDEIQQQIDQASNGGIVNITLNSDVTIDTPIRIYAKKDITGKTVNIDLAGHTISNANNNNTVLIELLKGTLNITGEGTISQGSTADGAVAIKVYGYEDPVVENWSVLNLGEKVIVSSTDEGVSVYGLFGPYYTYVKHSSGETVYDYDGKVYDGTTGVHYYNEYSTYSTYKYGSSSYSGHPLIASGAIDYVTSYPAYYKWTSGGYGCSTSGTNKYVSYYEKSKAFGVNITIAGNVHAKKYESSNNHKVKQKEK